MTAPIGLAGASSPGRRGYRLVVRGGLVVTDEVAAADVVAVDGTIVEVLAAGTAEVAGTRVVDAGGLVVLPGAIDPHVHLDEPGRTHWEGFDCGTAAAAAGGVTTVVDMPIDSLPPTVTAREVAAKADAARAHARVDVALWGGLVPGSVPHLDEMLAAGVVGFKAFACPSGWDDFPEVDEPTLLAGLERSAVSGRPVGLHAELAQHGHTVASEVEAVRWAAGLADRTGGHLHVVHTSAIEAVDEAVSHPNVTVETCPHYLLLSADDAAAIGTEARCNPPIRPAPNADALWSAVADGRIGYLASDHSPCPTDLKEGDDPWAGITGLDTLVPALLDADRVPLPLLVRRLTEAARLLRLPGKGAIAPGFDADLVLVDPDEQWVVEPATLHNRHRRSPFAGRTLRGRVRATFVRGACVYDVDEGPSAAGGARVLTPTS